MLTTPETLDAPRTPTATSRGAYFEGFWMPTVEDAADRLRSELAAGGTRTVDRADVFVQHLEHSLAAELLEVCSRTLVLELRAGLPDARPGATAGYDAFHDRVSTPDGHDDVLRRHPGLRHLVDRTVDAAVAGTLALARDLDADADLLERELGAGFADLEGIEPSSGDRHDGGRRVEVLRTRGGRVVHKPRPLGPEVLVTRVWDVLRPDLGDGPVPVPRTLDRGDHGWQEHVRPTACTSAAEERAYFEAMGRALAVFTCLGSGDLHHENVLACGTTPVAVDLECLVQVPRPGSVSLPLADEVLARALASSPLATQLLPARVAGGAFDINIAGIGAGHEQSSRRWSVRLLSDAGTDAMRFEQEPYTFRHTDNVLRREGREVDARRHLGPLLDGFRAGMRAVGRHVDEVLDVVRDASSSGVTVRQVLRPTALYARFLEASLHPAYLAEPDGRRRLFERLRPVGGVVDDPQAVRAAEIDALVRGDVPCFTVNLGEAGLRAGRGSRAPVVARLVGGVTPAQHVARHLAAVTRTALPFHEHVISSALTTVSATPWTDGEDTSDHLAHLLDGEPFEVARRIGGYLESLALWDDGGTVCTWMSPMMTSGDVFELARTNATLYEGGGMLVTLDRLARLTGEERFRRLVDAGVAAHRDVPASAHPQGSRASVLAGMASHLLLQRLLPHVGTWRGQGDGSADDLAQAVAALGTGLADEGRDLVAGLAGLAVALPALDLPGRGLDLALALRDRLDVTGLPDGELAHGAPGMVWGMARLAAHLDDAEACERAARTVQAQVDRMTTATVDPSTVGTWCKGVPGAAWAWAASWRALGRSADDTARLLEPVMELLVDSPVRTADVSLCHGWPGRVVAMLEVAALTGEPALRGRAREIAVDRLAAGAATGFRGGTAWSSGLVTYMLGLSGLADALLLLEHPAERSPLAFGGAL